MPYGIEYKLTKEQAEYIKYFRLKDYTWRAVAREVYNKWPDLRDNEGSPLTSGNQLDGIALCDAAMCLLGEKVEDGWN